MEQINLPPPLNAAIKLAEHSTHQHRHGAVIVKHGRIIGRGFNKIRHHKYSKFYPYAEACHAEAAAILDSSCDVRYSTVFVARINLMGNYRNSAPCRNCRNLLASLGFRRVVYTTNDGYSVLKLNG